MVSGAQPADVLRGGSGSRYNRVVLIRDLGEWGLIDWIKTRLADERTRVFGWPSQKQLLLGVGDDAAVFTGGGPATLCTTDTLVSGIHFNERHVTWREVGWKALAVNLSDVAAMGGIPKYAVVSLGLSGGQEIEHVKELYEGLLDSARPYRLSIVGGDIVGSASNFITIAVFGEALESNGEIGLLTRSDAEPGDYIAVTGYLGGSSGGLKMLAEDLKFDDDTAFYLRNAHIHPKPRVLEGQLLAKNGISTGIDVSDGLVSDIWQICKNSGVGARIYQEKIPVYSLVKKAFPEEYLTLALLGGEDYELVFVGNKEKLERVMGILDVPTTIVGEIVTGSPGEVLVVDEGGNVVSYDRRGWDHFGKADSLS